MDRFDLPEGSIELVEERTRDSKTFLLPGGGFRQVYGMCVHYRAGDADHFPWLDVVNEPTYSAPGTWVRNEAQVMISANYNALQMTDRYTNISWMWVFVGTINWADSDTIVYDGIPWKYRATPTGVKSDATVTTRQGVRTYSWQVNTNAQNVHVDDEGNIASDTFHIARAIIIGADGVEYEAGPWELPFPGVARFTVDDSAFPDEALPYLIDPSTSVQVDRSADDARWGESLAFSSTSVANNLGGADSNSGSLHSAILFRLNLSRHVSINSAWVRCIPSNRAGTLSTDNNVVTRITAAAQTGPAMVTSIGDANGRPRTTSVDWQLPHETNVDYSNRTFIDTPDISTVIQAAVGRIDRNPTDPILLFFNTITAPSSGNFFRQVVSYDGSSADAPVLFIDYQFVPPDITTPPSVNYNGHTRIGPNNTPGIISFTAESADSSPLTYQIRTGPNGTGTQVVFGNATSGVAVQQNIGHSAFGLTEGTNTLYLRVSDGVSWSDDASFTLLIDRTAPTVGAITHAPDPVTGGA